MKRGLPQPIALTIAGSDSGGGAGIQADLKTFFSLGVHGTSVVTALTAQNPGRVLRVQPAEPAMITKQLAAVFEELRPHAIKTGMLFSAAIVRRLARFLSEIRRIPPLIVDPVMISTSGRRLLTREGVAALKKELVPLASLVTPNVPEAEELTGMAIREPEDMRTAARQIHRQFGCAVLLKGGHLPGTRQAADLFYSGTEEMLLMAPRLAGARLHGTGCIYSAAIAGYCARQYRLSEAVTHAKQFITGAIARAVSVGGHLVLNPGSARP